MPKLTMARAWCNNEVGYLAWKSDAKIDGCLGFMITRIHLDDQGKELERRILPAWVAFNTQSNPNWEEQDMSVWPVQKFSWRDLTLRRSRDTLNVRTGTFKARYEIVPVGKAAPGRKAVPASPTAQPGKFTGKPIPLFFCGDPIQTNDIVATNDFGDIKAAFNNGILSTQNLRKQLKTPSGQAPTKDQVKAHIGAPKNFADPLRLFLAGDVLPALKTLFERADNEDGEVYLALYELSDPELIDLLKKNQERLNLVLTTAGSKPPKKGSGDPVLWDTENQPVRVALTKLLGKRMHSRFFNNSAHIGHNKFAVLVTGGKPTAVWTGSTNWTSTGLCAQTNNTIILDSPDVAEVYFAYWNRLVADKLPTPKPTTAALNSNQGAALRKADETPENAKIGGTDVQVWFSPNTPTLGTPQTRTVPPDLKVVFDLMKKANDAIFFLVFNPGRTDAEGKDVNTIVSAGIDFGRFDQKLLVMGAISDPTALPGYQQPPKGQEKDKNAPKIPQAAIFSPNGAPNVLMIRAAAIDDLIGDFQKELLSAGNAIIHDKIVVIDPLSEDNCTVITGSHNLGFKASYANDENMLIIRGNRALALAYAVHVMDVYDHYKFRAVLEQQKRDAMLAGKPAPKQPTGKGFLDTEDKWQDPYIAGTKGKELEYFLSEPAAGVSTGG
jgi:phosphatidylserine/phosphatidylglycerophosphate/cardiolipin synthase-like enzyme